MHRRKNMLAAIRRRRDSLGRVVVALFAAASFALGGAPCLAMAGSSAGATGEAAAAQGSHHAGAHEHSAQHDHAGSAEHGGLGNPAPARCPHCPPAGPMPGHVSSSAHSFCSAVDDVSDQTPPVPAKHVPPVATFETPRPLSFHSPPPLFARSSVPLRSTVALNVRHCVYLI
jgi:hypothetical protein